MNEDIVDAEFEVVDLPAPNSGDIIWKTKYGELVRVIDMDDKHLRNCALFLMGFGFQRCVASEPIRIAWLSILRKEWEKRARLRQSGIKKWNCLPERIE